MCLGFGEWLGVGEGELDVLLGVGEGELDVLLGVGEGELGFGLGVPEEEGDLLLVLDAVGLDEGLPLADLRDADVPSETDLLLADLFGVADELADLSCDAEEPASAAAGSWFTALFVADDSFVVFGISRHTADLVVE